MGRLFGTDGVRGLANDDLTPELALSVALASAHVLGEHVPAGHRPVAVVGRDPRASGEMLEAAVVAGLTSAGTDVLRAGVVPTPAVAFLVADAEADFGVVLSASHNPMPDNGVKLFAQGGRKLPDAVEDEIEARLTEGWRRPTGAAIGRVRELGDAVERYATHLLGTVPAGSPLTGLHVVVDCANGAAAEVAPLVYARAGAKVTAIGAQPDGLNINQACGSNHPEQLAEAVRAHGADLGIAHDGDADRCMAIAADGSLVDGDQILAICALALHEAGRLREGTIVATVMSNLGFHHAMREHGIGVRITPVGDRYVLERLRADGLTLGGEQSGHLIFTDHATTGDGILTGLQLLASVVHRLPQVLVNVAVADRDAVAASVQVEQAVAAATAELGDHGRVLLRPSGTEQLVRVMVEAPTQEQAQGVADRLAAVVSR
jgi:phosphoglucosamine mutase